MGKHNDMPDNIRIEESEERLRILVLQADHHLTSPEKAAGERTTGLRLLLYGSLCFSMMIVYFTMVQGSPPAFAVCFGVPAMLMLLFGGIRLINGLFPNLRMNDQERYDGVPLMKEIVLDVDGLSSWDVAGRSVLFAYGDFESVRFGPTEPEGLEDDYTIWVIGGNTVQFLLGGLIEDEARYITDLLRSALEG